MRVHELWGVFPAIIKLNETTRLKAWHISYNLHLTSKFSNGLFLPFLWSLGKDFPCLTAYQGKCCLKPFDLRISNEECYWKVLISQIFNRELTFALLWDFEVIFSSKNIPGVCFGTAFYRNYNILTNLKDDYFEKSSIFWIRPWNFIILIKMVYIGRIFDKDRNFNRRKFTV